VRTMPSTQSTEPVRFPADDVEIGGELARPLGPSRGALILIPDVHGISDLYRRIAGRFAAAGYLALVLDLYVRQGKPTLRDPEAVARWIGGLDDRRVLGDVEAAVRHLAGRPDGPGAPAIAGFCVGGQYALMAACTIEGIAACVSFYGMLRYLERSPHKPASPLDLASSLRCPYLGLFGAEDALIPLADVRELEEILRQNAKDFEIETFPGAGHAFLNDTRPDAYRQDAAERAWRLAKAFLDEHVV
jgi:carboxymethylenebutenolidase